MHQAKLQPSQLDPRGERSRTYAWDDPAISAAAAREVAGEEFLTAILNGSLPAAPVARTLEFAARRRGAALAEARLTDAAGKLYAHATSSCMIFRPPPGNGATG